MPLIRSKTIKKIQLITGLFALILMVFRFVFSWNPEVPAYFYFTVMSNVLCAIFWIYRGLSNRRVPSLLHGIVTMNMVITGIVFATVINPIFTTGLYEALDHQKINATVHFVSMTCSSFTHFIFPIMISLDFLLFCPAVKLELRHYRRVLLFPLGYSLFHSVYGIKTGVFLYPFLDPNQVGGWLVVLMVMVLMALIFTFVFSLLHRLKNHVQKNIKTYVRDVFHQVNEV